MDTLTTQERSRRMALAAVTAAAMLAGTGPSMATLSGFGWDRFFELSWEEEVQLHDGRVIVVRMKQSYERLGTSLTRYGGRIISRDTTLTFAAGGSTGVVTQLFKGFSPLFLGQHEGTWYAVLWGGYYANSRKLPGQDWGELEGPSGQWAIKLVDGKWVPISMSNLPDQFQRPNMLMLYGEVAEHAEFDGKRVTLADKRAWSEKHPTGPSHIRLMRPTVHSPKRPDSRDLSTGESK
jgi:hypothetical protein